MVASLKSSPGGKRRKQERTWEMIRHFKCAEQIADGEREVMRHEVCDGSGMVAPLKQSYCKIQAPTPNLPARFKLRPRISRKIQAPTPNPLKQSSCKIQAPTRFFRCECAERFVCGVRNVVRCGMCDGSGMVEPLKQSPCKIQAPTPVFARPRFSRFFQTPVFRMERGGSKRGRGK